MKNPAKNNGSDLLRAAVAHFEKRKPKLFALIGKPGSGEQPRIVGCRELDRYEGMQAVCVRVVLPGGQDTQEIHFLPYSQVATEKTLEAKKAQFRAAAASRPPQFEVAGKTDATAA